MSSTHNISINVPPGLSLFWNINNAGVEIVVLVLGVYMILTKSTRHMHQYKWFLLNIAVSIFLLDFTVGVILRPIALFPLYGAFDVGLINHFITTFDYVDNREVVDAIYRPYLALQLYILNNVTLCLINGFLYRWIALRPGLWLNNEKHYMYIFCATFQLMGASPEPIILYWCYTPMEVMQDYIRKVFFLIFYVGIALWALIGIFAALKSNVNSFSAQSIKLHRQLTLALMIQASTPFAMFIFPMAASLFMVLIGTQNVSTFCAYLLVVFCSHSNFNIVLMLSLTSCYRESLRDKIYQVIESTTGKKLKTTRVGEFSLHLSASGY